MRGEERLRTYKVYRRCMFQLVRRDPEERSLRKRPLLTPVQEQWNPKEPPPPAGCWSRANPEAKVGCRAQVPSLQCIEIVSTDKPFSLLSGLQSHFVWLILVLWLRRGPAYCSQYYLHQYPHSETFAQGEGCPAVICLHATIDIGDQAHTWMSRKIQTEQL